LSGGASISCAPAGGRWIASADAETFARGQGEWKATGVESGTKFAGVELMEDWFEYDEKAGEEVSVKDCVWEIRRNA